MGFLLSKLVSIFGGDGPPRRILMLGLDAAGKTTILCRMKFGETVTTIPTIGFNVEDVTIPGTKVNFTVWDVGGQERIRALWRHYYLNSTGLIYVVDSNDPERMDEARAELEKVLEDDAMRYVPVVIMANKQDLPGALRTSEIVDKLGLSKMQSRAWYVQNCVATRGDGLLEAFTKMGELSKEYMANQR